MGGVLSQPVELIRVQRCGSSAFRCAVAEMQGWRYTHEDAHAMRCQDSLASFWVLDGHGGDAAANLGAKQLADEIGLDDYDGSLPPDDQIQQSFEQVDNWLRRHVEEHPDSNSGSTVIGALAKRQPCGNYTVKMLNCGDSRGVTVRGPAEDESAPPLIMESVDHKPDHPAERARIEAAGGCVLLDRVPRLDGKLAVSRALGDFEFKSDGGLPISQQKVSCLPDVYELSDLAPGTLVVLACDGLWDVMTSGAVAEFVSSRLREEPTADLGDLAAELVRASLDRHSSDNVTVMIVHLVNGSDWANEPDEMKQFEKLGYHNELDEAVREKYLAFLHKSKFPSQPCAHRDTQRWFLEKTPEAVKE